MQTRMIGCVFVHLLTGFLFLQCESITLTSKGSIDGRWTFQEGGDLVTLTCNIPSYTGEMTWKFDSADAAKCTPQVCNQIISGGDGLFIFGFDISSYNFTWTFTPINSLHDGKVFACFNGANTEMFTAVVKPKVTTEPPVIPFEEIDDTALAAAILAVAGLVLLAIVLVVLCIETIRKRCNCCSREACSLLFVQNEPIPSFCLKTTKEELSDMLRKRVRSGKSSFEGLEEETRDIINERNELFLNISSGERNGIWWIRYFAMCLRDMTLELQNLHNEMEKIKEKQ